MEDINEKVTLLAILKKASDENIDDIIKKLANNGLFDIKGGNKILKSLQNKNLIDTQYNLTFVGEANAKQVEAEFKI